MSSHMKQKIKTFEILSMFSIIFLIGCGGGSSGTSEEITTPIFTPPPVNNAPSCSTTDYTNLKYSTVKHLDLDREFYVYLPNDLNSSDKSSFCVQVSEGKNSNLFTKLSLLEKRLD